MFGDEPVYVGWALGWKGHSETLSVINEVLDVSSSVSAEVVLIKKPRALAGGFDDFN